MLAQELPLPADTSRIVVVHLLLARNTEPLGAETGAHHSEYDRASRRAAESLVEPGLYLSRLINRLVFGN
jgi:hypothetical protein